MIKDNLKIYCENLHRYVDITGGMSLWEVYERLRDELGFEPIVARVNNKTENLSFPLFSPKQVEFMKVTSATGQRVYVRSLCMMLYRAVDAEMPHVRLLIEHSVCAGYYCRLLSRDNGTEIEITDEILGRILAKMCELHERKLPFLRRERLTRDVIDRFRRQGLDDKVHLLTTQHNLYTTFYRLDDLCDSFYGALAPHTGLIGTFDLVKYKSGFLLMGIDPANPDVPRQPVTQEKMFQVFKRYEQFNRVIRISNVADLNDAVSQKSTAQLINVAEAMHNNYISSISNDITRLHHERGTRIVMIAGPSSSGKTTFCKRLGIQLMTNLLTPKMISLDDYFVDRAHTPRDASGDYDYESLYALDLERLNSDLAALLRGETINLPTYSFELGTRIEKDRPLRLGPDDILIMEGIHGLNPELTQQLDTTKLFKIYVSALTTLHIDDHNWISTTDNRLLRRIVRDHRYRHTSALETIRRWPSVRRGEEKWIFPFQENADATFNSSLIFELGVMKEYAEPLLKEVPHDVPQYAEAYRLLKFLGYFDPIPAEQIPSTSLLREFLGGSSFHY